MINILYLLNSYKNHFKHTTYIFLNIFPLHILIIKHIYVSIKAIVTQSFAMVEDVSLKKYQLVAILNSLPKEYELSFELMPTSFLNNWTNVIHLTIGDDNRNYGNRTPGVWFQPDNSLYFNSPINDSSKNFSVLTVRAQIMEWTKVKISQLLITEKYTFTVQVGETEVYTVQNLFPQEFKNVKVYLSDPWYFAQPGLIRNVIISNTCEGNYKIT